MSVKAHVSLPSVGASLFADYCREHTACAILARACVSDERDLVRAGLDALGIRRFALAVHDAALPGDPRDDAGRGAPLSAGGRAFLRFAADRGFHALQLGPQGETTEHDQSPYDAAIFSRSSSSVRNAA